jgi:hypothetical protein
MLHDGFPETELAVHYVLIGTCHVLGECVEPNHLPERILKLDVFGIHRRQFVQVAFIQFIVKAAEGVQRYLHGPVFGANFNNVI